MRNNSKAHCSKCDAEWGGKKVAHCPTCHRTFKSVSGFDKHRKGKYPNRICVNPEDISMAKDRNGYWRVPAKGVDFTKIYSE